MKILLAEDETKVRNFIQLALKEAGMTVDAVSDITELISCLNTYSYEVLVLDRILNTHDTLPLLAQFKSKQANIKIIILSALSDVQDKVEGLTLGADDYLGKPFHVSELIARVRNLVKQSHTQKQDQKNTIIRFQDLCIDLSRQEVSRENDSHKKIKIELSSKEFKILTLLARNPGRVYSKTQLLNEVWDMNHFPESNVVEVTIAKLRQKLEKDLPPLILSRRGVGYWIGNSE